MNLKTGKVTVQDQQISSQLMTALIELTHSCLAFDFLGTNSDESTDDTRTAQLPVRDSSLTDVDEPP
jgi:exportin-7